MAQRETPSIEPAADLGDAPTESQQEMDLACPSCGADLGGAALFDNFRLCPACRRHFWIPARLRLSLLLDPGSFAETNAELVSVDPLVFHDPLPLPDRLAEAQQRSGVSEAVITGVGEIGGQRAVLALLDFAYLGGSIGIVAGEKITLAMELAASRRLPLIAICSGGAARTQEGILSLVQLAKTAAAAARLHLAGVPFISVLTHPTTGGVYAGLANHADIILAEPGAQIGFGAARGPAAAVAGSGMNTAEVLLARGMIDDVVDRTRLRGHLGTLLDLFGARGVARLERHLAVPNASNLRAWDEVALARHPDRPTSLDYLRRLVPEFVELHGDRVSGDDPAVICGLGRLEGVTVAVIAQERGRGAEHERRRGGRMLPEGYRKAVRLMRLAGHLELPIVSLVDTPGAMSGTEAEMGGIGVALAQALGLMSILPVPIISIVLGEGGSAGALALGIGDRILMLEHAVFSVVGPEYAGTMVYRESDRAADAASSLKLTARDCRRLGVIDGIIPEPAPAAHAAPAEAARQVGTAIVHALAELSGTGPRRLLDDRTRRVRYLGQATPEGREATHLEIRELQELQRTISRSLGDLRGRWEQRTMNLPNLPTLPHLPSFQHLSNLPNLRRIHVHRPDLTDLANRFAASRRAARGQGAADRGETGPETTGGPVEGNRDS